MITHYAVFEGHIKQGREQEFFTFVKERLALLWVQFPGASDVRILECAQKDDGAPNYAMVFAISYPNLEMCEKALESNVRWESRAATAELLPLFEGRVHHHIFNVNQYEPASGSV